MMIAEVLMPKTLKQILFWTPRILGILFTLFVGMFSLDVFEMGGGFWATLGGFIVHNIPTLILLAALVLGWRWEWIGAVAFIGFGVWYLAISWGKFPWSVPLMLAGIPMLVGVLFLVGWITRKQIRVN
jgi:hypothetical protein